MKVWICGRSDEESLCMQAHCLGSEDTLQGSSIHSETGTTFPLSGLTPAMQTALRGELDLLLVSDSALLGNAPEQIRGMLETFRSYGVSVRSVNNWGSSSS